MKRDEPINRFPHDSLCAIEGCGHRNDNHVPGAFPDVPSRCLPCEENSKRWVGIPGRHVFKPRVLAGGALNPSQEQEAYKKAMAGE